MRWPRNHPAGSLARRIRSIQISMKVASRDLLRAFCRLRRKSPGISTGPRRRHLDSRSIGRHGEDLAAKELARRGIQVVARNRRVAGVEIDILGFDRTHDAWVLAEIKTSKRNARPEQHLGSAQRRRLERAGVRLGLNERVRIVVLAVDLACRPPRIEMFDVI